MQEKTERVIGGRRQSERGKKTRQTEEEVGRQHQGMNRPGVRQAPDDRSEQTEMGENWLCSHLFCPNDPRSYGLGEG